MRARPASDFSFGIVTLATQHGIALTVFGFKSLRANTPLRRPGEKPQTERIEGLME
jgi:hypothetical protein